MGSGDTRGITVSVWRLWHWVLLHLPQQKARSGPATGFFNPLFNIAAGYLPLSQSASPFDYLRDPSPPPPLLMTRPLPATLSTPQRGRGRAWPNLMQFLVDVDFSSFVLTTCCPTAVVGCRRLPAVGPQPPTMARTRVAWKQIDFREGVSKCLKHCWSPGSPTF